MIRKATLDDIESIKVIADTNKASIGFVMRGTLLESLMHGWLLVAEKAGEIVAFANYRHCLRMTHTTLYEICVVKECRGRGYGRALIDAMKQESQDQGKQCIKLKTPVDLTANAFYARLGFELAGVEQGKRRALNVWTLQL